MLDLAPRFRIVFAAGWLALQGALVLTADLRDDYAFGFRMFPESTTVAVHLSRVLRDGRVVPVENGRWLARGSDGSSHEVRWGDRVKDPVLLLLDRTIHAGYGAAAQLARVQAALDDVAMHTPLDDETASLVADVVVVQNGGAPQHVRLTSAPR